MEPNQLAEYLAVLRDAGVVEATVSLGLGKHFDVKFEPHPVSLSPLVDREGRPIDLDEGMPDLARDEYDPQSLERANFPRPK